MDPLRLTIARAIAAERERAQMSQADLAARLGWTAGVISHIETGRRAVTLDEAARLCAALGISVSRLLLAAPEDIRQRFGLS